MDSLNKHPLEIWRHRGVTELLIDFFSRNFAKAGIPELLAVEYINKIWENKYRVPESKLREWGERMLNQAKKQAVKRPKGNELLDLIVMDEVGTLLDIGANKLSTINYYAANYPSIEKFIGIDIVPQQAQFSYS